ncbi:hypothetical protein ACO0R3_004001 [Hanseniaspora guilliermondii]
MSNSIPDPTDIDLLNLDIKPLYTNEYITNLNNTKKENKFNHIVRTLFSIIYLLNIIITIPISFQIGGIDCGLCFTFTIFIIYFATTTMKFVFFNKKNGNQFVRFMYYIQLFYIPPLLMICLSFFDNNLIKNNENTDFNILFLSSTLNFLHNLTINHIWPIYKHVINIWKWVIFHSTPLFTLLEGIFVILFIQTVGQYYKVLKQPYTNNKASIQRNLSSPSISFTQSNVTNSNKINENNSLLSPESVSSNDIMKHSYPINELEDNESSDEDDDDLRSIASVQDLNYYNNEDGQTIIIKKQEQNSSLYNILGLITSSFMLTLSIYYLYKIYILPNFTLNAIEATLIGIFFALVSIIGIYGIVSKKGSVLESSLMFAYLVRCIYQINPVLSESAMLDIMEKLNQTWQQQMSVLHSNNLNHNIRNFFSSQYYQTDLNYTNNTGKLINKILSKVMFYHKSDDTRNFVDLVAVFLFNILPKSIISVYKISSSMIKQSFTTTVVTNLTFRLLVYYSATRIIPTLNKPSKITTNNLKHDADTDREIDELLKDNVPTDDSSKVIKNIPIEVLPKTKSSSITWQNDRSINRITDLIYVYSPCILIAMYTNLTLEYCKDNTAFNNGMDDQLCIWGEECIPKIIKIVLNKANVANFEVNNGLNDGVWVDNWAFWNWVNILFYLVVYFFELQN